MFLHEFPDINYLKNRITREWEPQGGWPTVILNAHSNQVYRPDIKGPLSLFMNLKGKSRAGANSKLVTIDEDHYYLTNRRENYTLEIDEKESTETFNIHFGETFMDEVYHGLITPADRIMDDPYHAKQNPVYFFSKLYPKDEQLRSLISAIRESQDDPMAMDESLYKLMIHLLHNHRNVLADAEKLPPLKRSTRIELYKRLSNSSDYILEHLNENIELQSLADAACLSKFHFLRLYKMLHGLTPQQHIVNLRIKKAEALLKNTNKCIAEIALETGYENHSSFSRAFHRYKGVSAIQYRASL